MDLTSYGRLVAAFDELKLKADDELKWEQCSWATGGTLRYIAKLVDV